VLVRHNPCFITCEGRREFFRFLMRDRLYQAASSGNGVASRAHADAELSSAALFTLIWDALADLLGTAAAATLLRRAAGRATQRSPELRELAFVREDLAYRYTVPSAWNDLTGAPHAIRHLVGELLPLLAELTGPLAVGHLAQIPELVGQGIIPRKEEGS
jgi:hypothetical protein